MTKMEKQSVYLEELIPIIEEAFSKGESVQFHSKGSSMLPMLRQGKDRVVLSPVPERLKKYDVVLFKRDTGEYVLHRINAAGDRYLCLGDHQFRYEAVRYDQMIGKLTAFYRGEKRYTTENPVYWIYCRVWPTRRRFRAVCFKAGEFLKALKRKCNR